MRRTCRGVAAVVVAIAALACQPPVRPAADLRTPWRRMADSTAVLMHGVVSSADTASVQAMLALSDTASARWRGTLARARAASAEVQLAADATLASGERLLTVLGDPAEERDAREFGRYWAVGRTRLDVARASAVAAIAAADSALACSAAGCGAVMTRQVGSHAGAAAAAAREAESVLRIAIGFVQ